MLLFEAASAALGWLPPPSPPSASAREPKNFVADEALGWRLRPGADFVWKIEGEPHRILAGADGFRVSDAAAAAPAGRRIAFVGDSFTFGTGVDAEQTFAARVAAKLGAAAENRGMPGYGVDQMWRTADVVVLPDDASGPPPHLLVVTLILDDFERSLRPYRAQQGFAKPVFALEEATLVAKHDVEPGPCLLERYSRLWRAVQRVSYRLGEHHGIGEWWELNAACLDALITKARSRGVPVLLVYVPPHKSWRPFPALEEFASTREPRVPLVDLGSRWPGPPEGGFYESDGHLRVEGHRLVAEELVATIRREWPAVAAD